MIELPLPSSRIDALIHRRYRGPVLELARGPVSNGVPIPAYSSSMDAVVDLIHERFPGWIWRVCQCFVSDDAWLMPDMNHPEHGAGFQARWPDIGDPLEDGPGLDITAPPTAPHGRGAIALLVTMLEVDLALEEGRRPSEGVEGALALLVEAPAEPEAAPAP